MILKSRRVFTILRNFIFRILQNKSKHTPLRINNNKQPSSSRTGTVISAQIAKKNFGTKRMETCDFSHCETVNIKFEIFTGSRISKLELRTRESGFGLENLNTPQ